MSKALLVSHGFFGDIVFISSVARKLKEQNKHQYVDFLIGFPQMYNLLIHNPYIDNVYVADRVGSELKDTLSSYDLSYYDKIYTFGPFSFNVPPPTEAQQLCGIDNTDTKIEVWLSEKEDLLAKQYLESINPENKQVITWMRNWEEKAYSFTEFEYWNASDTYPVGYGKEFRNINHIIDELSKKYLMVPVGMPPNTSQINTALYEHSNRTLEEDVAIIKNSSYFIGTEGGLANLAAAVGTRTILTYEFIWQLYGPRGTVRRFANAPPLGPAYYFATGHTYLPLYKSDDEIIQLIQEAIQDG